MLIVTSKDIPATRAQTPNLRIKVQTLKAGTKLKTKVVIPPATNIHNVYSAYFKKYFGVDFLK